MEGGCEDEMKDWCMAAAKKRKTLTSTEESRSGASEEFSSMLLFSHEEPYARHE